MPLRNLQAKTPAKKARSSYSKTKTRSVASQAIYKPVRGRFGNQPFPKQLRNTVRYCDFVDLGVTAGIGKYMFSTNGLYDPDYTSTGHQPLYFDQLATIYDHYTVVASRIKVELATGSAYNLLFSMYVDDDTTTVTDAQQAMEQPGAKWIALNPSAAKIRRLNHKWNAGDLLGPADPLSSNDLKGTGSTNPTEQSYYVIQCHEETGALNTNVGLAVQIEYDVVWTEMKTMAQS